MTKEQTTNKCVEKIVRSDQFVENLKFQFLKVLHSKIHEKYNFCCGAQRALKVIFDGHHMVSMESLLFFFNCELNVYYC
jgi:hypothetical protein